MKVAAYLYFFIGVINVGATFSAHQVLFSITKPLLMPVLILFYLLGATRPFGSRDRLMIGAFAFSWVGDVALMIGGDRPGPFLAGLGGFLVTHLLYIAAFALVADRSVQPVLRQRIWLALPLAAYLAALLAVVFPAVDAAMQVPVAIYSAVIAAMAVFALNRYKRVNDSSFALVFGGALLFMLSDSLIAVDRFVCHGTLFMAGTGVMALYIAAQYLIARGMLQNDDVKIT